MDESQLAKDVCRLVIEYDKRSMIEARYCMEGMLEHMDSRKTRQLWQEVLDKACLVLGVPRHDSLAIGDPANN